MDTAQLTPNAELKNLAAEIVSSYLANNHVAPADLGNLITTVHHSLQSLGKAPEPAPSLIPAVPISQSIRQNYVVCLECGKRAKTLRRHISVMHDLTRNAYRIKWGLKSDHALTAPIYADQRSVFAKRIGLGQRNKMENATPSAAENSSVTL